MTPFAKIRSLFGRSLADTLVGMFDWVESRPRFLRPAFYGAFFIWALIIFRGGLYVLPVALLLVFLSDRHSFWPMLLTLFVLAPGGGFAGGLLYALVSPVANRLGVLGTVFKFTVAACAYLTVLVFVIMPLIDPHDRADSSDWIFIGGFGLVLGLAMTYGARKDAA